MERALAHSGQSHNEALRDWLSRGHFDLTVAGPYRDEREGKNVEAALISAMRPEFNLASGDGPRFLPLGVPAELADRATQESLTLQEIGRITGGALLVYLAPGDVLGDGRRKYDPAHVDDHVVVSNIEGIWDIGRHREAWLANPDDGPQILLGIHGKPNHRFIVGAVRIDTSAWFRADLEVSDRHRWRVPLAQPMDLDAFGLRGRRVRGIRFGQFSWQLHTWVDGNGVQRHPV